MNGNGSSNGYEGGSSGRVTMKDVYDIVGKLDTKLDALSGHVQTVTVDQEHRLTEQETLNAIERARVDKMAEDLQTLRDAHNEAKGRARLVNAALGFLGTAFCGAGAYGVAHALHWVK